MNPLLPSQHLIENALARALFFITSAQQISGSFESSTWEKGTPAVCTTHSAPFYTALIVHILETNTDHFLVAETIERAKIFLIHQESTRGSWNYWSRNSIESSNFPYPDDMDDTCAALTALYHRSPEHHGAVLAKITKLLIENEVIPGGPYYTWVTPVDAPISWNTVDIVVNANIAYFLQSIGIELEPLNTFLTTSITLRVFDSLYYHEPLVQMYFLARLQMHSHQNVLQQEILARKKDDGTWGDSILTACAVASLIRLDAPVETYASGITFLSNVQYDTTHTCGAFFIERIEHGNIFYSGCKAYSAALMVETLTLYQLRTAKEIVPALSSEDSFIARSIEKVYSRFAHTETAFREHAALLIERLVEKDTHHEITLSIYYFWKGISTKVPIEPVCIMSSANIFGWLGYTICDDIIDGEHKQSLLPLATLCIREVSLIFSQLLAPRDYTDVAMLLDRISNATYQEHHVYRCAVREGILTIPSILPQYTDMRILADKSIGHALGPYTLYLLSDMRTQAKILLEYYTQYLIARQLADDAHDWYEDMARGALTSVTTDIISAWQKHSDDEVIDLLVQKERLQSIFWHECIDTLSLQILEHTKQARIQLDALNLSQTNTAYFAARLSEIEKSAIEATQSRDIAVSFLETYKGLNA